MVDIDTVLDRVRVRAAQLQEAYEAIDRKENPEAWSLAQRRAGDARRTHEALTWRRREHPDWTLEELLDGGAAADLRLPDGLE